MTLATQKPFVDVLVSIEIKLVKLGWLTISRSGERRTVNLTEPRVLKWAIASCIKSGVSEAFILALLEKTPSDKHWYRVRTHLPEAAFYLLEGKLDGFLLSDEH